MTTSEQPPYDPNATTRQPTVAPYSAGSSQVQTVKHGPGWGAYLVTILALLVLAAVIVFVLQNDQPIRIKFFSWNHDFNKSSIALGAAAVAGFIAGFFLGLIPWMSARRKLRNVRRHGVA